MTVWVLFAGLPGTGKSTLARAVAERLEAAILDKDRIRAALFPGALTDYTAEQNEMCVRAMQQAAAYLTARERVPYVFFDGRTFATRETIEDVLAVSEQAGARWRILHLRCADAVAEQRLTRNDPGHPAKNRDAALYRSIQHRFEPILRPHLVVDTTHGIEGQLTRVERYLKLEHEGTPR